MSDQKPSIGRIVHRRTLDGCRVAIVTAVNTEDSVDITEFGPTGAVPFVRLKFGSEPGTVHWPERV